MQIGILEQEPDTMARRPFAFGARFSERGRSVSLQRDPKRSSRYLVELSQRDGSTRVSEHPSLALALREFAAVWRARLH